MLLLSTYLEITTAQAESSQFAMSSRMCCQAPASDSEVSFYCFRAQQLLSLLAGDWTVILE
jgi:hypothetical protein